MPHYRKKPVVIEARHFTSYMDAYALAAWCGGRVPYDPTGPVTIEIPTKEGVMTAHVTDYIIMGVAGEFYPCKAAIFVATYEECDEVDNAKAQGVPTDD